jgi:hypothetical protein
MESFHIPFLLGASHGKVGVDMAPGWLSPWAIWDATLGKWLWKSGDSRDPSWEFPNRSGFVPVIASEITDLRFSEHFDKILAAAADSVRNNEDLSAALPIVFTLDAQPDVPRTIAWALNSHVNITAFTLVIVGVDAKGVTRTETFTQAAGWAGETSYAYATITSITMTARTGTGVGDTADIGVGSSLGLQYNIDATADVFKVIKSAVAGNATDYSGAANITPDTTYDLVDVSTGAAIVAGDSFTILYKSPLSTFS